jgi:hypothetical protein
MLYALYFTGFGSAFSLKFIWNIQENLISLILKISWYQCSTAFISVLLVMPKPFTTLMTRFKLK